ncbi:MULTISPECIES: HNH endonuclease [Acinetobacter]|jgi:hypothetical protein|uniref:HNH endonuclease n=1 Tax=Acinetobacter TaxID=469 RepID=UPI00125F6141|nr:MULTISPECIES: HNH endonuclease [Acinetobacter]
MTSIDPRILAHAQKITAKRAKTVIEHIIKYGSISTEELKNIYGYDHPPRAARDVREQGIPLETIKVMGSNGRSIGAYIFGNPDDIQDNKLGGRVIFSKAFKQKLIDKYGSKCAITLESYDSKYLQIDHRIPYEVAGETSGTERSPEHFMLLSASAQRQKSWECEHCTNLLVNRDLNTCKTCYWAYPEEYTHVALRHEKRVDLVFQGEKEVRKLEEITQQAQAEGLTLKEFLIRGH